MPSPVGGSEFPVFLMAIVGGLMAPVLMFSWHGKYQNHYKSQENIRYFDYSGGYKKMFTKSFYISSNLMQIWLIFWQKKKILFFALQNLNLIWSIISQTGHYIPLGNWSQPIHKTWHSFSFILLLWTTKNNENYKLVNAYCRHVSICLKIKT